MDEITECRQLEICFPPPIYYSLHAAKTLAIILAQDGNWEWFYSNFIQVSFYNDYYKNPVNHAFHIYPVNETRPGHFAASQFLVEKHFDQRVFNFKYESFIDNIVEYVNQGFYVSCIADVSKIKGTRYEKHLFCAHGVLVIGYNMSCETFKILDFDVNEKIGIIDVSFADYKEAYFSSKLEQHFGNESNNSIILLEKKERTYHTNLLLVKELLEDYLKSYDTSRRYAWIFPHCEESTWGIGTYEKLIEYLDRVTDYIDYRMFHAFYEHKRIMADRFYYFAEKGILDIGNELLQKLYDNTKQAETIRILVLKFMKRNDSSSIVRIKEILCHLRAEEQLVYKKIIEIISIVS